LIKQLCGGEIELPTEVQSFQAQYKDVNQQPAIEKLSLTLFAAAESLGKKIYIIIDALDEFPEDKGERKRQELLGQIEELQSMDRKTFIYCQ
jgi:chromatin segregation and condensation protein Rec8/ScpA/Scc1 (kleisin family)